MDPDHTAPGSTQFVYEPSNILVDDKRYTFCDYALKGLINVSSVCFHEMHARLRGPNNVLILHQNYR